MVAEISLKPVEELLLRILEIAEACVKPIPEETENWKALSEMLNQIADRLTLRKPSTLHEAGVRLIPPPDLRVEVLSRLVRELCGRHYDPHVGSQLKELSEKVDEVARRLTQPPVKP